MAWIEKTQKEISNIVKVGDKNWKEVCLENYLFLFWNHQITGWDFFTWLEVGAMAERCIVIVKQFGPQDTGCHLMMSLKFMKLHCQIRCILNQDSCLKAPHKKRLEYIDFDLISWAAKNLWRDIFFRWTNSIQSWRAFSLKSKMKKSPCDAWPIGPIRPIPKKECANFAWSLANLMFAPASATVAEPPNCRSMNSILNGLLFLYFFSPWKGRKTHMAKKHIFGGSLWFNAGSRFLVLENRGSRPLFGSS